MGLHLFFSIGLNIPYMNKIIRLFFCMVLAGIGAELQAQWDSTYRPDVYKARTDLFTSLPVGKKDIVFYGNSITFWGDWSELLGSKKIKNRGIPGDTGFGLLELLTKTIHGKPQKVFIMIGINDLARGIPQDVIINNYKRIAAFIQTASPQTKIYFQSILPVNERFGKLKAHYRRAGEIPEINNFLREWTKEQGMGYVDVYNVMADENGRLKDMYTWDGVHLTLEGYREWVTLLRKQKLIR